MRYLFKAVLFDGTLFEQTQEDKSIYTEGKNAFYDVLQRLNEVHAFALINQETGQEYLVDLTDGHFEAEGVPFLLHNDPIGDFKLVFFKRNTIGITNRNPYPVGYNFGFEAKDLANNKIQRLVTLY